MMGMLVFLKRIKHQYSPSLALLKGHGPKARAVEQHTKPVRSSECSPAQRGTKTSVAVSDGELLRCERNGAKN